MEKRTIIVNLFTDELKTQEIFLNQEKMSIIVDGKELTEGQFYIVGMTPTNDGIAIYPSFKDENGDEVLLKEGIFTFSDKDVILADVNIIYWEEVTNEKINQELAEKNEKLIKANESLINSNKSLVDEKEELEENEFAIEQVLSKTRIVAIIVVICLLFGLIVSTVLSSKKVSELNKTVSFLRERNFILEKGIAKKDSLLKTASATSVIASSEWKKTSSKERYEKISPTGYVLVAHSTKKGKLEYFFYRDAKRLAMKKSFYFESDYLGRLHFYVGKKEIGIVSPPKKLAKGKSVFVKW
jgi:hypothetical protein